MQVQWDCNMQQVFFSFKLQLSILQKCIFGEVRHPGFYRIICLKGNDYHRTAATSKHVKDFMSKIFLTKKCQL